ncbi:MAG: hypothetical protein GQ582_10105 [Methyloprofundus sp.]|nr:hypothetical protein [Methyloprofundus sp.]
MRILIIVLFFGVMQPALAITKCTSAKGKVTYKAGVCPQSANSQYLIKHKFIDKSQVQRAQQKRVTDAEEGFVRLNKPSEKPEIGNEAQENSVLEGENQLPVAETKKMKMSNESAHFQLEEVNKPTLKEISVGD